MDATNDITVFFYDNITSIGIETTIPRRRHCHAESES